jgi:hypothetical protein
VYDLAVHLHEMSYSDDERDDLLSRWERAVPADCATGWLYDLDACLAHEQVKSAIVDTVRSCHPHRGDSYSPDLREVVEKLTVKLNSPRRRWGSGVPIAGESVERCLQRWARRQGPG